MSVRGRTLARMLLRAQHCVAIRPLEVSEASSVSQLIAGDWAWRQLDQTTLWPCQQRRGISVDRHGDVGEELSERDFHRLSDLTLGELMARLETLIEETPGIADSDLEYQQGVLTLNLGSHGTYVINKQSPNKQIWMSSPLSGPVRYDLVDGRWIYKHDGHAFNDRLAEELQQLTGKERVDLEFPPELEKGFVGYGADPT